MYQQTIIVGNLGQGPEMRYTPDGTAVTNFSVAVNRRWKNGDGETSEKTTWFKVTAWRRLAEVCNQYLAKGRQVMIIGEVSASAWTDPEGKSRVTLEITARDVRFLGSSNGGEDGEDAAPDAPDDEDKIPF